MGLQKSFLITSIIIILIAFLLNYFTPQHIETIAHHPALKKIAHDPTVVAILSSLERCRSSILSYFSDDEVAKEAVKATPKKASKKAFVEKLFTEERLKEYDGKMEGSKGPYLAFLGRVYDVRRGKKYYGGDGGYAFFSGRDASRAFITGKFDEEGLIADVSGLSSHEYLGLDTWVEFYEKDYKYIGKLIGLYYDAEGKETPFNIEVQQWIADAREVKAEEDRKKQLFPGCNSEYFPETGTRVWCTQRSGGVERDWVGVPRMMFTPGKVGSRCVCVRQFGPPSSEVSTDDNRNNNNGDLSHPNLKEFKGCPSEESSCSVPKEP